MAEKRVAILVSEGTLDWIKEEIARLCEAHERGIIVHPDYNPDVKNPAAQKISVERFLLSMLERRRRHRERRRAAAAKRKRRAAKRPPRRVVQAHQNADRG